GEDPDHDPEDGQRAAQLAPREVPNDFHFHSVVDVFRPSPNVRTRQPSGPVAPVTTWARTSAARSMTVVMVPAIIEPVTWEPELEEMRGREELARAMGGSERVERQHAAGRLTIRERVDRLLDPGSFEEYGALAGFATYHDGELERFTPANSVVGTGR